MSADIDLAAVFARAAPPRDPNFVAAVEYRIERRRLAAALAQRAALAACLASLLWVVATQLHGITAMMNLIVPALLLAVAAIRPALVRAELK